MKKPNDKNRPNSNTAKETRERERNYKYLWVSKRLFEVPVVNDDGSLTNIKQIVVENVGRTYTYPMPGKPNSREDWRRILWKKLGRERTETDMVERAMKHDQP